MKDRFRNHLLTIKNENRDFVEWHKNRSHYLYWSIEVENDFWSRALIMAQAHLKPFLLEGYERKPHITILPAGFAETGCVDLSRLAQALLTSSRFNISLGDLSSFTSTPCFLINDESHSLKSLRVKLRQVMVDANSQSNDSDYVPHMTVGLYRDCFAISEVAACIESFSMDQQTPKLTITSLFLSSYNPKSVLGPTNIVAKFDLDTKLSTIYEHANWFVN